MSEQIDIKVTPTEQEKKEGNLDPISKAPGAHPVGTGVGATVGGVAGVAAGIAATAASGLAMGPAVGGPVGAGIGLVAGAVIGGFAGKAVGEKIDPTVEQAYWRENHHRQAYYDAGVNAEEFDPAYRTGFEGRMKHTDKSFEEAEADLQSDYESTKGTSAVQWPKAKAATRAAWDRVS